MFKAKQFDKYFKHLFNNNNKKFPESFFQESDLQYDMSFMNVISTELFKKISVDWVNCAYIKWNDLSFNSSFLFNLW